MGASSASTWIRHRGELCWPFRYLYHDAIIGVSQLEVTLPPRPAFKHPPVAEVALGAYFEPIPLLGLVGFGELRRSWRDRYPTFVEQPALPPVVPESFGRVQLGGPMIVFGPSAPARVWYLSSDEQQLVQIQRDRLVHNWRRLDNEEPYPHYDTLRPRFEQDASDLTAFLDKEDVEAKFVQAEVSYVNQISVGDVAPGTRLAELISPWSGQMSDEFLPDPEEVRLSLRFVIPGAGGSPVGRLHVGVEPTLRQGANGPLEAIIQLQLFARGAPLGDGIGGILAFLDLGHDWLVRGFKSLTTREAHREWEIEEE